jgi:hypothetical protein
MPSDRVRVPASKALDEGACTNPDQMASPDQGGHPVAAVTAVGQVTGERNTLVSDQTKTQEFVHPLSVAWRTSVWQAQTLSLWTTSPLSPPLWTSTLRATHEIPRSPTGSGALRGISWPDQRGWTRANLLAHGHLGGVDDRWRSLFPITSPARREVRHTLAMDHLKALTQWEHAMTRLRALLDHHGAEAHRRAANYSERYKGQRAAMVFDVVASRQRRSDLLIIEAFTRTPAGSSLRVLAEQGPGIGHGLRSGEGATMQAVASGLVRFAAEHDLDDDDATRAWAESAAPFEHAPQLEPYVGSVKGISPALFAYMRMRSGADALKPDFRVRASLNSLGFAVPSDEHAILTIAHAAASDLGVSRLVLDQLLWWPVTEAA